MKNRLITLFIVSLGIAGTNAQNHLTLWYKSPAKAWEEALPVKRTSGSYDFWRYSKRENTIQ